ncbi:MAG: aminopeptidase P family protein [Clostridia bacterium]|nr:aminopeptidase P family protein [Clostridia bacterium]
MIDRNRVAEEKMARAAEMMREREIDQWAIYSRLKTDCALELMFNTDTRREVLFVLNRDGSRFAVCDPADAEGFVSSGLYTQVIPARGAQYMEAFRDLFERNGTKRLALNESTVDNRCDGLTVGLFAKMEKAIGKETMANVRISSYPMLEELRAVKTPSEIAIMRECSAITTDIYDALFERIRAGLTEVGVAKIMMEECEKRGVVTAFGDPPEYPLVLCPKGGMSHRNPNDINRIEPGDMLVIDFSIRYNGYTSDIARTLYFLKPGEEHAPKEVTDAANAAINAVGQCMAMIRPGIHGYEVDAVGRKAIVDAGYPDIPHAVGHQVGLEVHDGGTALSRPVRPASHGILRKNEIYALEPTVLQDRSKPSCIIEDDVLLTDDGCELISKRQTALIEIPFRS